MTEDARNAINLRWDFVQVPEAKNQRFLVSQRFTHCGKWFTDVLKESFPNLKITDGKDEPSKEVLDNSQVSHAMSHWKLDIQL